MQTDLTLVEIEILDRDYINTIQLSTIVIDNNTDLDSLLDMFYLEVFGPLSIKCPKMSHLKNIVILHQPYSRCVSLA